MSKTDADAGPLGDRASRIAVVLAVLAFFVCFTLMPFWTPAIYVIGAALGLGFAIIIGTMLWGAARWAWTGKW